MKRKFLSTSELMTIYRMAESGISRYEIARAIDRKWSVISSALKYLLEGGHTRTQAYREAYKQIRETEKYKSASRSMEAIQTPSIEASQGTPAVVKTQDVFEELESTWNKLLELIAQVAEDMAEKKANARISRLESELEAFREEAKRGNWIDHLKDKFKVEYKS